MGSTPLVDLSTLIPERPVIRIDGRDYHLRAADELTLLESDAFTRWGARLQELAAEPGKVAELEALLGEVAGKAMADVPDEVRQRLRREHHIAIVEVFTVLLLGHRARQAGAIAGALDQSTGPKPSPASSTPSAATPDGGSTAPQATSSGPT